MKMTYNDPSQSSLLRVQAIINELKPAERRIAEFILEYPHDVLSLTLNELAERTDTSYSTATRFITRLGFSGYKEFKKILYQDTLNNTSVDFLDAITFSQGISTNDICKNMFTLSSNILERCYRIVDPEVLEQAAQSMIGAGTVCFIGTGMSGVCARYAFSQFFRIGITCFYDEDSTYYSMKSALLESSDVLFAISSSGRSDSILNCVNRAKKQNVTIISLSDFAITPLSQMADINLFTTPRNSSHFMNIDMPLLIGQIFIIDALYMTCCVKMGKHSSELYVKTKDTADIEKRK